MSKPKQPTRRSFLKGTAVTTAAVATGAAFANTSAEAAGIPRKWNMVADVVVIGSGIAGTCAAIEAATAGAKVVVLEKDAVPAGCGKLSGGHMTVAATHVQKRNGIEDKPEWLYEDMMADSEWTAVPELIRKYSEGGAEHILWLEQKGIRFADQFQSTSNADRIGNGKSRGHKIAASPDYPGGPHTGGLGMMLMLLRAAEQRGVSILLKHKMTRLLRSEGSGPVIGVAAESEGKPLAIRAKRAVVVTTGGWSGNLRMGLAEDPRLTDDIYPDCWPYRLCLGEGHIAASDVGAELSNMAFGPYLVPRWGSRVYQIWEPQNFDTVPSIHTGLKIPDFQKVVLVKSDGNRYLNEMLGKEENPSPKNPKFSIKLHSVPEHPFFQSYLNLKERPRNVWAVTDGDGAAALGWTRHLDEISNPDPKSGIALYPGMVATAGTLRELASIMMVDASGLDATVSRYNGFVDSGKDTDFGRPVLSSKIVRGPFYAAKLAILKHTCRNGIRVNTRGQVLDRAGLHDEGKVGSIDDERVIPRLYAAGECAHYLGRYRGHGTLGIYSFYGRMAGIHAAAEKSSA
ncbi:MAG TPA: FAD-dependent oxidoreductase [Terriglobales bacterium]|nr:FAD-dependent oxidoreductase [Terriglobales bacterium]